MKLKQNTKYTTIAIYTVLVFAACLLVYKLAFTWNETILIFRNVLKVMTPFVAALLIAYFTSPMLNFFERNILDRIQIKGHKIRSAKIKRVLSIIMSYIVIIGTLGILLSFVIPQVVESIKEISNTIDRLYILFDNASAWLQEKRFDIGADSYYLDFQAITDIFNSSLPTIEQLTTRVTEMVPEILNYTATLATLFLNILLGFVIAIYLLFNKEAYTSSARKVMTALLPSKSIEGFFKTAEESNKIFTGFFIGKIIDSLIIGLICFVMMLILKMPYAVLISVIIGVTNMIPYFGPFIGGGIGILFILIGSPIKALGFALLILALQQFDGNILGPKILGDSTGLNPFWVIFAILTFGSAFGIMGMFIGVPCFAVIKNIFDNSIDRRYRERMAEKKTLSVEGDKNYSL